LLGLFSSVDLITRPDEMKEGGVVVEFKLRELEPSKQVMYHTWESAWLSMEPSIVIKLWGHSLLQRP